jgi:hypothetical protein
MNNAEGCGCAHRAGLRLRKTLPPRAVRSVSPALPHGLSFKPRLGRKQLQSRRKRSAISAWLHALIVAFRKVARAMTPVGCRPSVGSSGSIFCHHPVQPIYVPQCNVCPWKRTGDAAFVKGIEDGDPQIGACATGVDVVAAPGARGAGAGGWVPRRRLGRRAQLRYPVASSAPEMLR